ncbi:protein OSB1, mitochondrial-like [Amaranthus tricolor]|uniref:protein OSB1, mitochondrial-like n=1 Tax=Amaranthus tricolor TaxID=29722 RepID=UPI002584C380|nr:protein OSB1, mitochondrial-like [Amaranthus tricolor]
MLSKSTKLIPTTVRLPSRQSPITTSVTNYLTRRNLSSGFNYGNHADSETSSSRSSFNGRNCARPSTVTWSSRLHNSARFIGTVEYPLKQYNTRNGRLGVYTFLRVKTSPYSNSSFRILFEMWGELAERVFPHLKPDDFIYISGELGSYTKDIEGVQKLMYKVTARELNYVKLDEPGEYVVNSGKNTGGHFDKSHPQSYKNRLHLWQLLFASPDEWHDQRRSKTNPKQPDFKHKSTGEALWLSASDPPWVKKQVELLYFSGPNNDPMSRFSLSGCL